MFEGNALMTFGGIQKLTLLDYPERTACTLFTIGCNFRCPYCQNKTLLNASDCKQTISASEVLAFLRTRQKLLDGVCISGGEPLMQKNLASFIKEVKELGFLVKIDTNGTYPQRLSELIDSGIIDYVAMDIKNTPEKYAASAGVKDYDITPVLESMDILHLSSIEYEYRTTVVRELHTEDDLVSIANRIRGKSDYSGKNLQTSDSNIKYFLQGFVDSGDVLQKGLTCYTAEELQHFLCKIKEILPTAELRGV